MSPLGRRAGSVSVPQHLLATFACEIRKISSYTRTRLLVLAAAFTTYESFLRFSRFCATQAHHLFGCPKVALHRLQAA